MVWESLDDPIILAALAGGGSAALAIASRLSRVRSSLGWRVLLGACLTNSSVGGSVALVLLHVWPGEPMLVLAVTVLASYLWDWTADETRRQWRSVAAQRVKQIIEAAIRGDDKRP